MDPKANIKEQLQIAKHIISLWDEAPADGVLDANDQLWMSDAANRLAELVLALDEWQRKGGFSPYKAA